MSIAKVISTLGIALCTFSACKYQQVDPANYPDQALYMTTARGSNGIYAINTVPTPPFNGLAGNVGTFQFTVDLNANKLTIPLSVSRSGVNIDSAPLVNIVANTDTVSKLVTKGLLTNVVALTPDKYTLTPSVTVASGQTIAPFNLTIDLPYLVANTDKVFALGVTISSTQGTVNPKLNTTVLMFDAKVLKPAVANFTVSVTGKVATFSNTSTNGATSSWNFGDGSAISTTTSPNYTYAASGNYSVTLTSTGVLGAQSATSKTVVVTIP